jgi:1,2-diacylglycerol 3-alpha-glucosyltransferase
MRKRKMSKKLSVGFLSYWGIGRGLAEVTRCYSKMIQDDCNVFILKQGTNEISDEFKNIKAKITEYPEYLVDEDTFRKWIKDNKLDVVIFNEYDQWTENPVDLIKICKSYNVSTIGFLVMERLTHDQLKRYDRIIVPTISFARKLRQMRFRRFNYVPMSIDLTEFPITENSKNEKFTFFHPAGYGGVADRKNTKAVIDAFKMLDPEKYELIITSQKKLEYKDLPKNITVIEKDLDRKDLLKFYQKSDVTVLPSRWETIGIPILESLASGTPVITTNAPPMNEFIKDAYNGYTVYCKPKKIEGIMLPSMEVDVNDLARKMETINNDVLFHMQKKMARKKIENDHDLEKNKKYLLFVLNYLSKDSHKYGV